MFALQAAPTDLSWLPLMGEVALIILGFITLGVLFIKRVLPRIVEYRKEIAMAKINAKENTCGELQTRHENQLKSIETLLIKDTEKWDTWHDAVTNTINEIKTQVGNLFNIVSLQERLSSKLSEGTLTNQLFSDELWPFLRLKAFRRLLAMKKNGRIWEKGKNLAKTHKEDWLNVQDTELGIEIVDQKYYEERLDEIEKELSKVGESDENNR